MATRPAQQAAEAHLEEVLWAGQGPREQTVHIQAEALQAASTTSSALKQHRKLRLRYPNQAGAHIPSR